jgi:hypothetical protein
MYTPNIGHQSHHALMMEAEKTSEMSNYCSILTWLIGSGLATMSHKALNRLKTPASLGDQTAQTDAIKLIKL